MLWVDVKNSSTNDLGKRTQSHVKGKHLSKDLVYFCSLGFSFAAFL